MANFEVLTLSNICIEDLYLSDVSGSDLANLLDLPFSRALQDLHHYFILTTGKISEPRLESPSSIDYVFINISTFPHPVALNPYAVQLNIFINLNTLFQENLTSLTIRATL